MVTILLWAHLDISRSLHHQYALWDSPNAVVEGGLIELKMGVRPRARKTVHPRRIKTFLPKNRPVQICLLTQLMLLELLHDYAPLSFGLLCAESAKNYCQVVSYR